MKRRIIASLFILLAVISGSGVVLAQYPEIKKSVIEENSKFDYSHSLMRTILAANYAINYNLKTDGNTKTPSEVFIQNRPDTDITVDENDLPRSSYISGSLDTTINQWDTTLKYNCQNLMFYALDHTTEKEYASQNQSGNIPDGTNLKAYLSKDGEVSLINKDKREKYEYQWVVTLHFDETGALSVLNQSSSQVTLTDYMLRSEQDYFLAENIPSFFSSDSSYLSETSDENSAVNQYNRLTTDEVQTIQSAYQFNTIKNMTVVYALPKILEYNDDIALVLGYLDDYQYWNQSAIIILSVLLALILITLLVPIKFLKESSLVSAFRKIPLDFLAIFWICAYWLFSLGTTELIPLTDADQSLSILNTDNLFFAYTFNFLFYAFMYLMAILSVASIKQAMSSGWRNFFKQTFIYKCLHNMKNGTSAFFHYLDTIDLRDSSSFRLIGIILLNLFLLFVMIATSGFGMLLAIAYSIVILIVARNYITKVRKNYLDLLEVTKNIAEGNLEKEVNQDLGIFNSFKEDITNIRYSFKNAVDEEVKSQKMKTELISNVSHDLKTPLTSIITYTDLLKRTDITEEERTNYFETLERNEVRLKHLIEDLFEVSKVNSGNVQLNIQQIDIISLMSQVIIEHEDSIKKLELSIKTNYSDEKILLNLDSQKTYRVLANLITNISKYAMPKSRVYVEVTDYGESVELSFKNMSANEIDFDPNDIVERFARGDKARNTEGSGLGLAISKSFTELQGGSFRIYVDGDLFKAVMRFPKNEF